MRRQAVWALSKIKDPRAIQPLIGQVSDQTDWVKTESITALKKWQPEALEPLLTALKGPDRELRYGAARVLAELKEPRSREALLAVLSNPQSPVGPLAAIGLNQLGVKDPRGLAPLMAGLKDKENWVRQQAARALGDYQDLKAVEPLLAALEDKDKQVRAAVATALGKLGDSRAVGPLVKHLTDWPANPETATSLKKLGWEPKTNEEKVYFWAASRQRQALKDNWPTVKPVLWRDLEGKNAARVENSLRTFVFVGNDEVIPGLIAWLGKKGNETTAVILLNCGNARLKKAAEDWAKQRGYLIFWTLGAPADSHWES